MTRPRRKSMESSRAGLGFSTPVSMVRSAMVPLGFMTDPFQPVGCAWIDAGRSETESLDRIGRIQVLSQEAVGFRSRLLGELSIESIELMPTGRVLVDLVLKLPVRG